MINKYVVEIDDLDLIKVLLGKIGEIRRKINTNNEKTITILINKSSEKSVKQFKVKILPGRGEYNLKFPSLIKLKETGNEDVKEESYLLIKTNSSEKFYRGIMFTEEYNSYDTIKFIQLEDNVDIVFLNYLMLKELSLFSNKLLEKSIYDESKRLYFEKLDYLGLLDTFVDLYPVSKNFNSQGEEELFLCDSVLSILADADISLVSIGLSKYLKDNIDNLLDLFEKYFNKYDCIKGSEKQLI